MSQIDEIAKKAAGGRSLEELRRAFDASRERKRFPTTKEQSEKEAEYWKNVFSEKNRLPKTLLIPVKQEMQYVEARKMLIEGMEARQSELKILRNEPDFKLKFTPQQGSVIETMLRWLINDPLCSLNLRQGIWLYGNPGTFKTELMRLLEPISSGLTKQFMFTDFSTEYAETEKNVQFNRAFDEFLKRTDVIKNYGNAASPTEQVIEQRYKRFMRYGQYTIIITNFSPNSAAGMMSTQAFDRLRAMVNSLEMPGESKRR